MPNWGSAALPYPAPGASPDVPGDMLALVQRLQTYFDENVSPVVADITTFPANAAPNAITPRQILAGRRVFLEGAITVALTTTAQEVATLTYAPVQSRVFTLSTSTGASARVVVNSAGVVTAQMSTGTASLLFLDGVTFRRA